MASARGLEVSALFLAGQTLMQEPQPVQSMGEMAMEKCMPSVPLPSILVDLVPSGAFFSSSSFMTKGRITAWGQT